MFVLITLDRTLITHYVTSNISNKFGDIKLNNNFLFFVNFSFLYTNYLYIQFETV